MDLEHVCVVHRKWFRNLRVRIERPDYVEYRLTGLFYGLKQEVLARGGPVDHDQYWYEFVTAVARMRVEGRLEGEDGHLMQTEVITFHFAPPLAPLFWCLRPLFIAQKHDILRADTALLEREYALEQGGFERRESRAPRVVVYGGNGFFGRIIVDDLLRRTRARIEIASRTAHRIEFPGFEDRVRFFESDLRDPVSVRRTIAGADPRITQTKICISPGTRHPRGPGSFACLLSTVGREFSAPIDGREAPVTGWTEPERVSFPAPMGDRTAYRVVDIADHFIQPRYFGTRTVEFRIGSELGALNLLLSTVRRARLAFGIPLSWLVGMGRVLIQIAALFGSTAGGVMVEVAGYAGDERRSEAWCVLAGQGGERIPSMVAAIAAGMVLRKEITGGGIVPLPDWITRDRLIKELAARGIRTAVGSAGGGWKDVGDTAGG